jgi:hypothetical protein
MHATIGMLADAQARNAKLSDEIRELRQTILDGEPFREAAATYLDERDLREWAGFRLDHVVLELLKERDQEQARLYTRCAPSRWFSRPLTRSNCLVMR